MFFPTNAPLAEPVYYRTYARFNDDGTREDWPDTCERVYNGLVKMGHVTPEVERTLLRNLGYADDVIESFYADYETESLVRAFMSRLLALPSGRNLWVLGTEWATRPENYYGLYNCCARDIENTDDIAVLFDLLCQGSGTGANVELLYLNPEKAPFICHHLSVSVQGDFGTVAPGHAETRAYVERDSDGMLTVTLRVGDSRQGWVEAYRKFMRLATSDTQLHDGTRDLVEPTEPIHVVVDISHVRAAGSRIKGFGGRSNPTRLISLFENAAKYLNKKLDTHLDSVTACLLLNEAGLTVVAGNVRRCLPSSTLVETPDGRIPIKDVKPGQLVNTPLGFRPVTAVFDQGVQQTWQFLLESGHVFTCTDKHRNAAVIKDTLQYNILRQAAFEPEAPCRHYPDAVWVSAICLFNGDKLLRQVQHGHKSLVPDTIVAKRLYDSLPTFDIEVAEAHCFFADGYLTHNSANIQIGNDKDEAFKTAKDNLWMVDESGTWVIDPERDAMRMANLSRVFHHKPSYDEILEAVTKQYHSGEGAILYANESIARCNVDLFNGRTDKLSFIHALDAGQGAAWIKQHFPAMPDEELNHRLLRYSTNPCFVGETLVVTHKGIRRILDIVGKDVAVWTGAEWVNTRFRQTQDDAELLELTLYSGLTVTCTPDHPFFLLGQQGTKLAKELKKGDVLQWTPVYANTSPETGQRALMRKERDSAVSLEDAYDWGFARRFDVDTLNALYALGSDHQLHYLAGLYDAFGSYLPAGKNFVPTYDLIAINENEAQVVQTLLQINRIYSIRRLDPATRQIRIRCAGIHALSVAVRLPLKVVERDKSIPLPKSPMTIDKYFTIRSVRVLSELSPVYCCTVADDSRFTLANQVIVHNCGEVIGKDFMCSITDVHLNQFASRPTDLMAIKLAFTVSAWMNASHLHQQFVDERFRYSRAIDPITQVTFTGAVDYFVALFGQRWLEWWQAGRPYRWGATVSSHAYLPAETHTAHSISEQRDVESVVFRHIEKVLLTQWREAATQSIQTYCTHFNLVAPIRYTGHQPAGCTDLTQMRNLDQGLVYLDEALLLPTRTVRSIPSLSTFDNYYQPLRLLVFRNGRQIYFTLNHKIQMHSGEWRCAKDINVGDVCFHVLGNYEQTHPYILDYSTYPDEAKLLDLQAINGPVAKFLGLYWMSGYSYGLGEEVIWFSTRYERCMNALKESFEYLFNHPLRPEQRSQKTYEATTRFSALARWLECTNTAKLHGNLVPDRVPLIVRRSALESIVAFIAGVIEAKGRLNKDRKVTIAFTNWLALSCLQQCAESVGIPVLVQQPVKVSQNHKKPAWRLVFQERGSTLQADELLRQYSPLYDSVQGKRTIGPYNPFLYEVTDVRDVDEVEAGVLKLKTWDISVDAMDEENGAWYFTGALNSHNTKSLLTGASSGVHLPKGQFFIRRITFAVNDPVALACRDYGYRIVPGQGATDETGRLLDDPYDPRVKEWLVEIPTKVSWGDVVDDTQINIAAMPFDAQWDFCMMNQQHWTTFNTSATLEFTKDEIPLVARRIFEAIQSDAGYISAALLARDSQTFPRMPFEPIDRATYEALVKDVETRRITSNFGKALKDYDRAVDDSSRTEGLGGMACDSDKCLLTGAN